MSRKLLILAVLMAVALPASAVPYTAINWDNMNYANGNLNVVGNPANWSKGVGWAGTAGAEMSIVGGALKIGTRLGTTNTQSRWINNVNYGGNVAPYVPAGELIAFRFQAKKGEGDVTAWNLTIGNAVEGAYCMWWTGQADKIICRGSVGANNIYVTLTDEWQTFTAFADGGTNTTYYWLGATYLGSNTYVGNNRIKWVTLSSVGREDASGYAWLDNMSFGYGTMVIPEPSGLLALSVFGVGMIGYVRRRR